MTDDPAAGAGPSPNQEEGNSAAAAASTTVAQQQQHLPDKVIIARLTTQLKKLNEANGKYKTLLKLAKERIQHQEEELESLRKSALENGKPDDATVNATTQIALEESNAEDRGGADTESTIVRVLQRVKENRKDGEEIWALMEFEEVPVEGGVAENQLLPAARRYREWKRFDTESELSDFIRRDTGEPLTLPPYSLSPRQSQKVLEETNSQVSKLTEEFRRFRVKSELARKQADAQIRELQNTHVQSATRRISSANYPSSSSVSDPTERRHGGQQQLQHVDRLKSELAALEAHWKEAYDVLLAENNALKSAGSEALLAAQWRQRYEACLQEKEDLESKLKMESSKQDGDASKYELKYRDLKESFRLYRKKAKEIFEAQQRGESASAVLSITDSSSSDAKLAYLRNLMVNYLSSDQAVRGHMETAIGTVLKFTPDEMSRIQKKKEVSDSWF